MVIIRFSFCPLGLLFGVAGPERAKNPAGKTPPPVSDPFDGVESGKNPASLSSKKTATPTRRFNLHKRGQLFIRTHNETLAIAARCASAIQIVRPSESKVDIGTRGDIFVLTEEQRHKLIEINREFLLTTPHPNDANSQVGSEEPQQLTNGEAHNS